MSSNSSSSSSVFTLPVIAALAAGAIAAVAATVYLTSSSEGGKKETEQGGEVEASRNQPSKMAVTAKLPKLTKEQLLATYSRINLQMEAVTQQLVGMKLSALQQLKNGSAEFSAEQVIEFLMAEFENNLAAAEKDTYASLRVTEEEVTEAQDYFQDDATVTEKINVLKALYEKIGEEPAPLPEVPAHLTMEETLKVTAALLESMNVSMEQACEEARVSQNIADMNEFKKLLQTDEALAESVSHLFMAKDAEAKKKIQNEHNATSLELQAACLKYQNIPEFGAQMQEVTLRQQERFQALGVFHQN